MRATSPRSVTFLVILSTVWISTITPALATGPDAAFGDDGVIVVESDTLGHSAWTIEVAGNGDTWVGGLSFAPGPDEIISPWLVRLGPTGEVVTEVTDARVLDAMTVIEAIAEDARGRLIVVGQASGEEDPPVLARLHSDGSVDESFGDAGFTELEAIPGFHGQPTILVDGESIVVAANGSAADNPGFVVVGIDATGSVDVTRFSDGVFTDQAAAPDQVLSADAWWLLPDGTVRAAIVIEEGGERLALVDITDEGMVEHSSIPVSVTNTIATDVQPFPDGSSVFGSVAYRATPVDTRLDLHRAEPDGSLVTGFAPSPQLPTAGRYHGFSVPLRTGGFLLVSDFRTSTDAGVEVVAFDDLGFDAVTMIDPIAWEHPMSLGDVDLDPHTGALVFAGTELSADGSVVEQSSAIIARFLTDDSGRFIDDDGSVHESDIVALSETGVTKGCNPPTNTRYCPNATVTRAQMASFLVRAIGLPSAGASPFSDTAGNVHESDIAALAAAGITRGCNPPDNTLFCSDAPVTRGQMASFLVRAFDLDAVIGAPFTDITGSVYAADISALAAAGITTGCAATRYCPEEPVTRAQMASFLIRAMRT